MGEKDGLLAEVLLDGIESTEDGVYDGLMVEASLDGVESTEDGVYDGRMVEASLDGVESTEDGVYDGLTVVEASLDGVESTGDDVYDGLMVVEASLDGIESTEDGVYDGLMVGDRDDSMSPFGVGGNVVGLVRGLDGEEAVGRDVSAGFTLKVGVAVNIDCGRLGVEDCITSDKDTDGEALKLILMGRRSNGSKVGDTDIEGIALGDGEEEFCNATRSWSDFVRAATSCPTERVLPRFGMECWLTSLSVLLVVLLPVSG